MNVARRTVGLSSAAALVWFLVGSAYAQTPAPSPSIRIDNFGQVDATYYRGAQPEARD